MVGGLVVGGLVTCSPWDIYRLGRGHAAGDWSIFATSAFLELQTDQMDAPELIV